MSETRADFRALPQDKFRQTANKLLNECFLLKKNKETAPQYHYLLNNREAFIDFFDCLGYEVIINEAMGVIGLNNPAGTGRIHLKKLESVLLLILRLLYIEKRKVLSQAEDVLILVDDIYDKYNMLKFSSRLDKTGLRNAMGLFRRYRLINNLDADMSNPETRVVIWPSILFAIPIENIEEPYEEAKKRLERYANGGNADDGADEAADDSDEAAD